MALIIAGGYASTYGTEAAEIGLANEGKWFPTTIDFRATAAGSGGAKEAKAFTDLLDLIGGEKQGSIKDLGVVGHASRDAFSLAGRVTIFPSNVIFADAGIIDTDSVEKNLEKIKGLRDRFAKDAKITLYACNFGLKKSLLEALSNAFGVCVYGFANEIFWCFRTDRRKIIGRGRTYYDANGNQIHPDCDSSSFTANITDWGPDSKSCAGVTK